MQIYIEEDNTARAKTCCHLSVTAMAERVTFKNVFRQLKRCTTWPWKHVQTGYVVDVPESYSQVRSWGLSLCQEVRHTGKVSELQLESNKHV
jgi:hypothetical protein